MTTEDECTHEYTREIFIDGDVYVTCMCGQTGAFVRRAAGIDPDFAREQSTRVKQEWYEGGWHG